MMTCAAPAHGAWGTGIMGGCSIAWLVLAAIFILGMVLRRQTEDGVLAGTGFNFIGAMIGGMVTCIVLITLFGAPKWGFIGGIAGLALGGFGLGLLGLGDGDGGGAE